jgi:hypothetical protein
MATSAATQEAMWLNRLLQQLGLEAPRSTKIYENNKAAILVITRGASTSILEDTS